MTLIYMIRRLPSATLFPYTTLFRSLGLAAEPPEHRRVRVAAIIELLDRGPNLRLEPWADARLAVDDAQVRGEGSRSEEHTSELQSRSEIVCRLLLEKKKKTHLPRP